MTERNGLDNVTRIIHLGLTVFGILAWLTGLLAGDYNHPRHFGFTVHKWLGITLSGFLFYRLWYGFYGPPEMQFAQWVPYTRERLGLAGEDLLHLAGFKLPDRPIHQGLSGVVQTFGLGVFTWMAATGTLMFFFLEPGRKAGWLLHGIKEVHEAGLWLIPIFLGLHGGAVLLHALSGNHLWRRTFYLE